MFKKSQIWCSYLSEILLETASSPHNGYLEVTLHKGRLRLNTENITYSYEDLYVNYALAFEQLGIRRRRLRQVLLLGFGLGSVAVMLQKKFGQQAHYVGIDIDEVVLQLAQKYLPSALLSHIELHCANAALWVQQHRPPSGGYDLIAVDVFIDRHTPDDCCSPKFLQETALLLSPQGGQLVYNALADTDEQKQMAQRFYDTVFNPIFADAFTITTPANLMLISNL